jgi:hypothetical protein
MLHTTITSNRIKNIVLLLILCLPAVQLFAQDGVLIDYVGNSRESKAIFQINSTTQGAILPRMTAAQRGTLTPAVGTVKGLTVYQTDAPEGYYYWDGALWQYLASSTGSGYIQNLPVTNNFTTGQAASFDVTGNGEVSGSLSVGGGGTGATPSSSSILDVNGGTAVSGDGKAINLQAQHGAASGNNNGGNVNITSGQKANSGTTGKVNINTLNTSTGDVNISNGTATQTVGIANNSTGVKTVTIGGTAGTSSTTINAGTGGVTVGTLINGLVKSNAGVLSNGVIATDIPTTVSNTSSTNTLSTTVNGVTGTGVNIINTNVLGLSGNDLSSTVNGIASNNLDISPIVKEPWNVAGGTTAATSNTQNIYQNGNVGIGDFSSSSPAASLDVQGRIYSHSADYGLIHWAATDVNNSSYLYTGYANEAGWYKIGTSKNGTGTLRGLAFNTAGTETVAGSAMVINTSGDVGIGTPGPAYKLDINGALRASSGILNSDNHIEKVFSNAIAFPNSTPDQAADILFGNIAFWGYIEVEVNSTYNYQNSTGKLTKIFAVGTNPGNNIYTNESRVSDAMGTIPDNVAIGDFAWDGANYKIPISHIVSSGNTYTVKIRVFSSAGGAKTVFDNTSISGIYTLAALAKQYVYYNGKVGIGTLGANLPVYTDGSSVLTTTVPTTGIQGFWTRSGTDLYNTNQGDNVGIGTTAPVFRLHIKGGNANTEQMTLGATTTGNFALTSQDGGAYGLYAGVGNTGNAWLQVGRHNTATAYNLILQASGGNVGIGTTGPATRLHVNGGITMSAATNTDNASPALTANVGDDFLYNTKYLSHYGMGFHVPENSSAPTGSGAYMSGYYGVDLFAGGASRISVKEGGNVGIGTTNPRASLNVNGGFGVGTGNGISTAHGAEYSIQLNSDTYYGGTYDNHSGFLMYSTMPGGWGTSELHFAGSTNWGTYDTGSPALTISKDAIKIDNVKPILIRSYSSTNFGSNDNINWSTGISDVTYSCVLGGFSGGDSNDIEGVTAFMYRSGGVWWIRLDLKGETENGWTNVDCVCYKREMVDDNR